MLKITSTSTAPIYPVLPLNEVGCDVPFRVKGSKTPYILPHTDAAVGALGGTDRLIVMNLSKGYLATLVSDIFVELIPEEYVLTFCPN